MTQMESEQQQPATHARTTANAPSIDSSRIAEVSLGTTRDDLVRREAVFTVSDLDVSYSGNVALKGVGLEVYANTVTAFIGPSGCGKSTFIRCFNRMNDLIVGA
jgi:phosphate transport system ATP-binding protein